MPQLISMQGMFLKYLEKAGLKGLNPGSVQYVELRRSFFAGSGQMLLTISNDLILSLPENEYDKIIDDVSTEVAKFLTAEKEFLLEDGIPVMIKNGVEEFVLNACANFKNFKVNVVKIGEDVLHSIESTCTCEECVRLNRQIAIYKFRNGMPDGEPIGSN